MAVFSGYKLCPVKSCLSVVASCYVKAWCHDWTSHLYAWPPVNVYSLSLSLAWGFVADVDIESEKYRHVGAARFTVGTLVRLASLRVYRGKLAYLPIENSMFQSSPAESIVSFSHTLPQSNSDTCCYSIDSLGHTLQNSSNSNNASRSKKTNPSPVSVFGPIDSLLTYFFNKSLFKCMLFVLPMHDKFLIKRN